MNYILFLSCILLIGILYLYQRHIAKKLRKDTKDLTQEYTEKFISIQKLLLQQKEINQQTSLELIKIVKENQLVIKRIDNLLKSIKDLETDINNILKDIEAYKSTNKTMTPDRLQKILDLDTTVHLFRRELELIRKDVNTHNSKRT